MLLSLVIAIQYLSAMVALPEFKVRKQLAAAVKQVILIILE
jgi:hypothetical protein